jgi:hypothetical protein
MDVVAAHTYSSRHRAQIESSDICACFYCLSMFPPGQIVEWVDDEDTAICPRCGIDSVIGSESGVPLTPAFLKQMKHHWFEK